MAYYVKELRSLKEKTLRKIRLEKLLDELEIQRADLEDKVFYLEASKKQEQKEADRLEGRSLAAFFYTVIGRKEERLEKEQQEARAAAVKYDTAARELAAVKSDVERYESELHSLEGCEEQYEKAMSAAVAVLRDSGRPGVEEILRLEDERVRLQSSMKEHEEAVAAGDKAYQTVCTVLEKLTKAEDYGTWDMFGGGIITDIIKHDALDEAQELIEQLQVDLRRFNTELSDVDLLCDIQVNIDGFLRFADFFFDGLFADFASLKRIEKSKAEIEEAKSNLEKTLNTIIKSQETIDEQQAAIKEKLDELVLLLSD